MLLAALATALVLAPALGLAQRPNADVDRFVSEARDGTRRYRSQANAIADGFKRVGVEFPAMGEHWVNLQRVMEDTLAAPRPSVLIYVNVHGQPRLAGVGYTALLDSGEQPPDFAPARGFWHEHNGTVADESFPLAHQLHREAGTGTTAGDASLRLSILHAWIWTPNADGLFTTENWALPSLRVGAAAPVVLSHDAMRAMALASDSSEYYALMLRTGLSSRNPPLTTAEERSVLNALAAYRDRAARDAALVRGKDRVTSDITARLATTWTSMWVELERRLPARVGRLRELRQLL
jgi:hypothetical protein